MSTERLAQTEMLTGQEPQTQGPPRRRRPGSWSAGEVLRAVVAVVVGLAFLFPLYIALVTSLDTRADVFTFPPHLTPDWHFINYIRMWHMGRWLMYFGNTTFITLTTIAIALITSILAAYALSFLHFRRRELVFVILLVVLMVPGEALLIPNYVILHMMHLLNTRWAPDPALWRLGVWHLSPAPAVSGHAGLLPGGRPHGWGKPPPISLVGRHSLDVAHHLYHWSLYLHRVLELVPMAPYRHGHAQRAAD